MKRTVPLAITTIFGFLMIVSFFIPAIEWLGEFAAVCFDILAAIAFVLGGGNLLQIHLQKVSDRAAGWGYSAVTLIAFLVTLTVGLGKIGTSPAPDQEHFGETFAYVPVEAIPESQVTRLDGALPQKAAGGKLPPSVRRQLGEQDGQIFFRGWMRRNQMSDLQEFQNELAWQCTVERLFEQSQPPQALRGKVVYYAYHGALGFSGPMSDQDRRALLAMGDNAVWTAAIENIFAQSNKQTSSNVGEPPVQLAIPEPAPVSYHATSGTLSVNGPMSVELRDELARGYAQFPLSKPLDDSARQSLLDAIEGRGPQLNKEQRAAFYKVLDGIWPVEQLRTVLDEAGSPAEEERTACEMLADQQAGASEIAATKMVGEDAKLNEAQVALLEEFAADPAMTPGQLGERLRETGPWEDRQQAALVSFFAKVPTIAERDRNIALVLLRNESREAVLTQAQRDFLLDPHRAQFRWQQKVGRLFLASQTQKYPWSGSYRDQGSPFWWIYEYLFQPLTATMFALLAFYVASAAFRAFRAKNAEATLLLGTAFVILLGQTFAGIYLTSWMPEALSGLRTENLNVWIMMVMNTAGTRAIMIGIALGIASTSLKVLLGIDRSYLGSGG